MGARRGARAASEGRRRRPDPVERAADELYGLPLEQFVPRRKELAKTLRADGDRDAAAAVEKLQKPNVAAWTANQLARRQELDVRRLLKAGEALSSGKRQDAEGFREARAQESEVVRRLLVAARELLQSEGKPSDATLARVGRLLRAAALDDSRRELLATGRLTEDLAQGESFTLLASAAPAAAPPKKGKPAPAKPDRAAKRRAEQAAAEANKAEQELARAEQRLAEARDAVAELRKQAREARSRAKRLDAD